MILPPEKFVYDIKDFCHYRETHLKIFLFWSQKDTWWIFRYRRLDEILYSFHS